MFGVKRNVLHGPLPLVPFLLKLRDGFLLGVGMDPAQGSPCPDCYTAWLSARNIWHQRIKVTELPIRKDLIHALITENNPHVTYEIAHDGTVTRMDNIAFPHPACACQRENYVLPAGRGNSNYAFSPIHEIKCARFGTPEGNWWLTSAVGESPLSNKRVVAFGVEEEKEASRSAAVDEWLKQSALSDLRLRLSRGEQPEMEMLSTSKKAFTLRAGGEPRKFPFAGVGATQEEATVDALITMGKRQTLERYSSQVKNPMLIVGANNWIRTRVPFFLLQQYDLHLLFYPNSMQLWVVGLAAFSRQRVDEKPLFVFASDVNMEKALKKALGQVIKTCQPGEWFPKAEVTSEPGKNAHIARLNMWWTHWIYRCPKISLKDVLHLEPYTKSLEEWRSFARDGQLPISFTSLNSALIPKSLRSLVAVDAGKSELASNVRNVNGIGTWADFRDGLI